MSSHSTKGVIFLNSSRRDIWLSIDIHLCLHVKAHAGLHVPLTICQSLSPSPLALPSPQLLTLLIPCYSLLFSHSYLSVMFHSLSLSTSLSTPFSPLSTFPGLDHTQSDGHVQTTSLFLCSALFQMPLDSLSLSLSPLISTLQILTISWTCHISRFFTVPHIHKIVSPHHTAT